tara:strand:+ start:36252 stop:38630 length:2379 start_codon:yes stop_codon:yes gene_type:complete
VTDWAGYLQHFTEEGFSEEGIRILLGENPDSDSVLFVQETLEDAKKLIMMLDSVPKSLTESANGMKRRLLQHPSELEDIRARYNVMVVATTPWVASAEKMREQWSMEGRSIELAAWLRRLGSIDHNPPKETREVIQVIENIAPRDEVRRAIENLEGKQRERRVILQDMMNILERKGWNLEFSEHANLSQKFEEVSEWLELEDRIEALERKIFQFEERRPNEANMGLKIIEKARLNGDRNAIKQLELDVNDEIQDILESDEEIKTRLNYWSQNGLIITDSEILTNNQLWKFEENLDELEKHWNLVYEKCIILRNLLDKSGQKYPDWIGHVDSYEKILTTIDELTDQQKQLNDNLQLEIETWRNYGLNLELIGKIFEGNNVWELDEQINGLRSLAEIAISILNSIDYLDQSIDSERIGEIRESVIRDWNLHSTLQFEMEEIDKISRRQEHHLVMLYERAEELSMDVTESNDWTIEEFENRIFDAELIRNRDVEKRAKKNEELNKNIVELSKIPTPKEKIENSSDNKKNDLNNWIEKKAADGKLFYYNQETKQSTWSKPDGIILSTNEPVKTPIKEEIELIISDIKNISEENDGEIIEGGIPKIPEIETVVQEKEPIRFRRLGVNGIKMPVLVEDETKMKNDTESVSETNQKKNLNHILREKLGINNENPLIVESSRNRDLRIQRILRLIPLIESKFDSGDQQKIVDDLLPVLENIEQWIRVRSEHRRCWNDNGGIVQKIDRLQDVLDEVPGPGIQLPIGFDKIPLPSKTEDLIEEIKDFSINALVSTSGGIIAL